ncbi:putative primosome PriB/single-strand DNA-binding, nucleic acid-binding protein [Dioscorea sansibarensis]
MALPTLPHRHPHLLLRPSPSQLPFFKLPNPCSNPSAIFSSLALPSSSARRRRYVTCSTPHGGDYEHERVVYPRPQEVPWSKDLANSVHLIGLIGAPVQIKHLSSGKVLAWTRLAVRKSATDTTWISLTFWDELAHVAFQHVEKGQQVYVSGRLVSDTVEGDDEKDRQVYYKVVVHQLNFVERNFPPVPLYEPGMNFMISGVKPASLVSNNSGSMEQLWQAFFANPVDWWDNRTNKRNPKAPDFKHKHTGEALWIEGKYNPPWVKSQLAILDTRMGSLQANGSSFAVSFMHADEFSSF